MTHIAHALIALGIIGAAIAVGIGAAHVIVHWPHIFGGAVILAALAAIFVSLFYALGA